MTLSDQAIDDLMRVLPGPPDRNRDYIDAIIEEVVVYRNDALPYADERERANDRLDDLAKAAKAFAAAVAAIRRTGLPDALERRYIREARKQGAAPDEAMRVGSELVSRLWPAAATAKSIARVAAEARVKRLRPQAALRSLVESLGFRYGVIFGVRPSAAKEGYFAKSLRIVFGAAAIKARSTDKHPARIGQTWLEGIVDRPLIASFKAPKRSRSKRD